MSLWVRFSVLWLVAESPLRGKPAFGAGSTADSQIRIMSCYDGDTCTAVVGVRGSEPLHFKIRLAGIDAPELHGAERHSIGQPLAEEARDRANSYLAGKVVELRQVDVDRYNRIVAEVIFADANINIKLLEDGLAQVYQGRIAKLDRPAYEKAEASARVAKRGIWGFVGYVPPQEFRKARHPRTPRHPERSEGALTFSR